MKSEHNTHRRLATAPTAQSDPKITDLKPGTLFFWANDFEQSREVMIKTEPGGRDAAHDSLGEIGYVFLTGPRAGEYGHPEKECVRAIVVDHELVLTPVKP